MCWGVDQSLNSVGRLLIKAVDIKYKAEDGAGAPVPRGRLGETGKPKVCEGVRKRPAVRFRTIKPAISQGKLTMGGKKNKRRKAVEAHSGSLTRKKGMIADKDMSAEKKWGGQWNVRWLSA